MIPSEAEQFHAGCDVGEEIAERRLKSVIDQLAKEQPDSLVMSAITQEIWARYHSIKSAEQEASTRIRGEVDNG